jgi:hypothetical protein
MYGGASIYYAAYVSTGGFLGIAARNTTSRTHQGSTDVRDGIWHHFAAVFSSATDRRIYLDGVEQGTQNTNSVTFNAGTTTLYFGRLRTTDTVNMLTGDLDDILVVPTTLSQAEVSNLYQYSAVHKLDKPLVTKTDILGESITGYEFIGKSDQLSAGTDYYGNHLTLASPKFAAGETYSIYMEFMMSSEWTSIAHAGALIGAQFGTYMAIAVLGDRLLQQREDDVALQTSALTAGKKYKLLADYSRDGANLTQNIYLDGTLAATQTVAWSDTYAAQNTYIGYEDRYHYRFNGVISKPIVFDRILTESERNILFDNSMPTGQTFSSGTLTVEPKSLAQSREIFYDGDANTFVDSVTFEELEGTGTSDLSIKVSGNTLESYTTLALGDTVTYSGGDRGSKIKYQIHNNGTLQRTVTRLVLSYEVTR